MAGSVLFRDVLESIPVELRLRLPVIDSVNKTGHHRDELVDGVVVGVVVGVVGVVGVVPGAGWSCRGYRRAEMEGLGKHLLEVRLHNLAEAFAEARTTATDAEDDNEDHDDSE